MNDETDVEQRNTFMTNEMWAKKEQKSGLESHIRDYVTEIMSKDEDEDEEEPNGYMMSVCLRLLKKEKMMQMLCINNSYWFVARSSHF